MYSTRCLARWNVEKVPDGTLRSLDLQDAAVREVVRAFEGGKISPLYVSNISVVYK